VSTTAARCSRGHHHRQRHISPAIKGHHVAGPFRLGSTPTQDHPPARGRAPGPNPRASALRASRGHHRDLAIHARERRTRDGGSTRRNRPAAAPGPSSMITPGPSTMRGPCSQCETARGKQAPSTTPSRVPKREQQCESLQQPGTTFIEVIREPTAPALALQRSNICPEAPLSPRRPAAGGSQNASLILHGPAVPVVDAGG